MILCGLKIEWIMHKLHELRALCNWYISKRFYKLILFSVLIDSLKIIPLVQLTNWNTNVCNWMRWMPKGNK